jgi:tRNA threonylcarbamoyladenosine biosynthesis protein TsaE
MVESILLSTKLEDTHRIGQILAGLLKPGSVVILSGSLGSGKTVFVKGMAEGLNVVSPVVSPSYTIAAVYEGDLTLAHVDLYRTGSDEELELLGFDDLAAGAGITAVEWGEKAERFLDTSAIHVSISIRGRNERSMVISNISDEMKKKLDAEYAGA